MIEKATFSHLSQIMAIYERARAFMAENGNPDQWGTAYPPEEMIRQGLVLVNGVPCQLGDSADPDKDEILVEGKMLPAFSRRLYIMLHKPRGYVTTLSDEKGRTSCT